MIVPSRDSWAGAESAPIVDHPRNRRRGNVPSTSRSPQLDAASEPPAILIVDDDQTITALLADLLREEGYRVTTAVEGAAAVALARRSQPALLITDSMMPGMGGMDLIRELRRHPETRSIPVILMSSVNPRDHQLLNVPFLAKPFGVDELLEMVAYHVHTRPRAQLYGEG